MLQAQAIVGFSDDSRHQTLHIEDVRNEDGSETGRSFGRTRPSTSTGRGAGGGRGADGAGVESTHSVFKNLESQVHQLGISLETVSSHIAALAQLASLAANSGSHAFGGSGGGNGSATPRLGGNPRARPEVLETGDGKDTGLSSCTNRSASQRFFVLGFPTACDSVVFQMWTSLPTARPCQPQAAADLYQLPPCLLAWPSNDPLRLPLFCCARCRLDRYIAYIL